MTAAEREQVAREALAEFTAPGTYGDLLSDVAEGEGVFTLNFAATMGGYPGWHWTVSLAELEGEQPTVLETELMPGDGALLAPDWVPWSERLDEYRAAQAEAGEPDESVLDADTDDDDDADLDLDDDHGDDPADGIDFEDSDLFAVGEDEQHEAEAEPEEDGPEPPAVPAVKNRRQKKQ
ncbi:MAG TPA: DUF3027 domain-containing protein [Pseudolysinimonas sp.]|nr:DUF3027 domain-containing protein [Pseudolysinimonas sp.]